MIYVNPLEFSIIQSIISGATNPIEISKRLNKSYAIVESRIYFFMTMGWMKKENSGKKTVYVFEVNPDEFQCESFEMVRKSRGANRSKNVSIFSTDHISSQTKKDIGVMIKKGMKRTEVAKMFQISKADLLNVMHECNYRSPEVYGANFETFQEKEKEFERRNEVRNAMIEQYMKAHEFAKKLVEKKLSHNEIADRLNQQGFVNLHNKSFGKSSVCALLDSRSKKFQEVPNESELEEIAQ